MAEKINMPRLSDTMEEGTVAKWFKKVGDLVKEGDIIAEIETDKATMEFESFSEGELLYIGIKEGETAPVDSLLAILGNKGEDISKLIQINDDINDEDIQKEYMSAFNGVVYLYDELKENYEQQGFNGNSEQFLNNYKNAFNLFESEFEI